MDSPVTAPSAAPPIQPAPPLQPAQVVYLSQLALDLRRRSVWRLLGDTYALHRWVLTAFPEAHEGGAGRVLFRVESGKGEAKMLVQSSVRPDWSRLHGGDDLLRGAALGPKAWRLYGDDGAPIFVAGQRLRFRLRASPSYRCSRDDAPGQGHRKKGKRYGLVTRPEQADWLVRKGAQHGFALPMVPSGSDWLDPFSDLLDLDRPETRFDVRVTPLERLHGIKPAAEAHQKEHRLTHLGVDFDGTLTVTDPHRFAAAVAGGIGAAKGFGFGLLSLARL
jgi:CRISPR-associated protein Cas6/Cse3/CasE, subtype I-E/ECOLI